MDINQNYHLPVEEVEIKTEDGIALSVWHLHVKNPKAVLILLHGYALPKAGKSYMLHHANYLHKEDYAIIMPDLRSFGESGGSKVSFGVKEWLDVSAVYNYVKQNFQYQHIPVGIFGISYGGAVALITAGKNHIGDFIISSTPFASVESLFLHEMEKRKYPSWLFLPIIRLLATIELGFSYKEDTPINWVSKITSPLFIIQALHDNRLPSKDALALYNSAMCEKNIWQAVTGHDVHGENPKEFEKRVLAFIRSVVDKKTLV